MTLLAVLVLNLGLINFLLVLIFLQLQNVQRTLNRQLMNAAVTDHFRALQGVSP